MLPVNRSALFGVAGQGNDSFTKLLLHFDGANGSTTITDSSVGGQHGNGTIAGPGTISTATAKFGGSSFVNGANSYITFPNHADWEFGAGSFTVDWFEYRAAAGGCAIARDLSTTYCPFLLGYGNQVYLTSTGSSWDIASGQSIGTSTLNTWTHKACVRNGTTFYTFQDGVQQATWSSSAAIIANSNALCIGAAQNGQNFNGYTDELRISKGIARWTANFTPPAAPYS